MIASEPSPAVRGTAHSPEAPVSFSLHNDELKGQCMSAQSLSVCVSLSGFSLQDMAMTWLVVSAEVVIMQMIHHG